MKIIDQSFEIDHFAPEEDVRRICRAARICYQSKELTTYEDRCEFIERLMKRDPDNPHHSPLEHSSLSVIFTTNRAISHELVRHRIASFNQESTRYCTYSNDKFTNNVTFINDTHQERYYEDWLDSCRDCERKYFQRLNDGYGTDEARGVLNNDVKTEIMVTANYREWRHILKLRTSKQAHYQMRELMIPLKEYLAEELPCVFGEI